MSPKISEDKKQEQRNKIINGAINVFKIKGFEQTTMKDIRESAGVSAGSLYMYFSNKEEILIYILEGTIGEYDLKVDKSEGLSCWQRIENYIDSIKLYSNNIQNSILPIVYEYSITAWKDETRKKYLSDRYDLGIKYIKDLIEEGINSKEFSINVDINQLSSFIVSAFEGINTLSVSLGSEEIESNSQFDFVKYILKKELNIK